MKANSQILAAVYDATLKFLSASSSEKIFQTVVKEACRLVDADMWSLYLYQDKDLHCVYTTNSKIFRFPPRKKGYTFRAFKEKRPIIVDKEAMVEVHPEAKKSVMQSYFCIPLSYRGISIGVLNLESRQKNHFGPQELETLTLYGSFASLAIQKDTLYRQANDAVHLRDRFIALASHEIKTPLTSSLTYLQLMKAKKIKQQEIDLHLIDSTIHSLNRLTLLVNELMNIESIRSGKLMYKMEDCDLYTLLNDIIEEYKLTKPAYYFNLGPQPKHSIIFADPEKLRLVIANILNNAIKFSPEHSTISITLSLVSRSLKLTIRDQGEGIDDSDIPFVLEPFYKGAQGQKEGLGIGLFLSKSIVEHHHGILQIESTRHKGTSVMIILPINSEFK